MLYYIGDPPRSLSIEKSYLFYSIYIGYIQNASAYITLSYKAYYCECLRFTKRFTVGENN